MKRTSPGSLGSRLFLLAACALLVFAPAAAKAVPVTLTIDNPNQSVVAPTSGFITLTFSGTVSLEPNYRLTIGTLDSPFNGSHSNFLQGAFASDFLNFFINSGTGTYTGSLFNILVPAGAPVDLYAFSDLGGASLFSLEAQFVGDAVFGGIIQAMASQAFSVQVTGGTGVPDGGSSMMLLGLSLTALGVGRRVFASRDMRLTVA